MAEFVVFDPNVEVHGISVVSINQAMGKKATPILQKYNLEVIDPEAWYNQQNYLKAFEEVSKMGFFNLISIGMKIPDLALFPPIKTVEEALALLDTAYQMNHRGGDIGEYRLEKISGREAHLICRNPYPSDFDYGLIYRLTQKFLPDDSDGAIVIRDETAPTRKKGADSCTYIVKW
ncbi:MAG: hypothetical protein K8I82_13455 [Anaerolineae bacterium]|nr:hypothetical protein [Anaerolineae bacterium]